MSKNKRQIRNYFLDRGVQLKITVVMVLISSILTSGLGYFWYSEIRTASDVIRVNAMSTIGDEAATQLAEELATQDRRRLMLLVGFALLFAFLIAGYGVVMTHRIAGPLLKIRRHVKDVEEGRLYQLWGLRKGDQLQDFFGDFHKMHDALRERVEQDMATLGQVIEAIENKDDLEPMLAELRRSLSRKGASLRSAGETTLRIHRNELE